MADQTALRQLDDAEAHITAALQVVEQIDGWAEDRATITRHLTNAKKKARELRQNLTARRPVL